MVEMIVFLVTPAEIEIELGGKIIKHNATAGMTVFTAKAQPGNPIFRILRQGVVHVEVIGPEIYYPDRSVAVNALYCGGSSTRKAA